MLVYQAIKLTLKWGISKPITYFLQGYGYGNIGLKDCKY